MAPTQRPRNSKFENSIKTFDIILLGTGFTGLVLYSLIRSSYSKISVAIVDKASPIQNRQFWFLPSRGLAKSTYETLIQNSEKNYENFNVASNASIVNEKLMLFSSSQFLKNSTNGSKDNFYFDFDCKKLEFVEQENMTLLTSTTNEQIRGLTVIDCRGLETEYTYQDLNEFETQNFEIKKAQPWVKYLGIEIELENEHNFERPNLFESNVQQVDGYRHIDVFPLSTRNLYVRDVYHSNHHVFKWERVEREILNYLELKKIQVKNISNREIGLIPISFVEQNVEQTQISEQKKETENIHFVAMGKLMTGISSILGFNSHSNALAAEFMLKSSSLSSEALNQALDKFIKKRSSKNFILSNLGRALLIDTPTQERRLKIEKCFHSPDFMISNFINGNLGFWDSLVLSYKVFGARSIPTLCALLKQKSKEPFDAL